MRDNQEKVVFLKLMKVAHLILTYTNPQQTERMIRKMSHPDFDFYIHVDKKIDIEPYYYLREIGNVRLIEHREDVSWGGYSTVKATFNSIKEICSHGIAYSFINFLSGQDYPLKPAADIAAFFKENVGNEFLSYVDYINEWDEGQLRYKRYFLSDYLFKGRFLAERLINLFLPERKLPYGYHPYGKSMFWMLSPEAALYVVSKMEKDRKLRRFFFFSWASDEFIFQTVLMNSHFRDRIVNNNYRYIDWTTGGAHPKVLVTEDFPKLKSSDKLFARKFDVTKDARILDLIDTVT